MNNLELLPERNKGTICIKELGYYYIADQPDSYFSFYYKFLFIDLILTLKIT